MKVVSLETAKKLKEAGFPQPLIPTFYYHYDRLMYNSNQYEFEVSEKLWVAAPTADEILEKLPHAVNDGSFLHIRKDENGKYAVLYTILADTYHGFSWYENLSEAAAQMYEYLKKEGLI